MKTVEEAALTPVHQEEHTEAEAENSDGEYVKLCWK